MGGSYLFFGSVVLLVILLVFCRFGMGCGLFCKSSGDG